VRPLEIGVIGAGTAGSAAALMLRRAGHEVCLIERFAIPGAIGAGIVLQPSGLGVLRRLGLDGPILAAGARLDGLRCRSPLLRLFDLRYERLAPGLFGLGLHRGVLFRALFDALAPAGVALALGRAAVRLEADGDRHFVRLERVGDTRPARLGPFDLIVIADGARSTLRAQVAPHAQVRAYPWGALWFVGEAGAATPRALVQAVRGTREMIGLLPTGHGPEPGRGPLLSLFFSVAAAEVDALRRTELADFRARVAERLPEAAGLVEQLERWDQLLYAAYHDVVLPAWHARGVVLLGDAAHATSPQLGQGCNLALLDAEALARALDRHDHLLEALSAYSASRRASLGFYQRATRWLTPLFQGDDEWLATLRDLAFPLLSRTPPFERRMLESMAGLSTGWLSATEPR
jgi:2-polyprenyl-6-methoxyphenol hydroxylase-like FAD-dependent oxidoreductase